MTAEGSVYRRKDGRWVAQYKDARGKTRYIYRKTKTEAKRALREALRDRDNNIVPPSKMSVSNLLDEWLEDRRETISLRTWISQESIVRCRIKQHIGSERLCTLSGKDVQHRYRRMLKEGLSASTVRQIHVLLKQALRYAVRQKYIRTNPLNDVKPPRKKQRTEKAVLTAEQVNHLLDTVRGDRFECIYVVL